MPLLDVMMLAGLYTLRIIAGAAAITIPLSFWLDDPVVFALRDRVSLLILVALGVIVPISI